MSNAGIPLANSSEAQEVTTAAAQQMHRYSPRSDSDDVTHGVSISLAMPRLSTTSPLRGADCVGSHDTSPRCAIERRERDVVDNGRCNGEEMHTQSDGDVVSSLADGK